MLGSAPKNYLAVDCGTVSRLMEYDESRRQFILLGTCH